MGSERFSRLRAGIQAGLIASAILGFVIWLFGYITGERLATSLLSVIAVCVGLICAAQVYTSRPDVISQEDDSLAELEELSEGKALGKMTNVANNKHRAPRKAA